MAHDVLVIGGGPGGATAALLLARAGWSVALVERKGYPRRKVCGEYLSATNLPLLEALGMGDVLRQLAGPGVSRVGLFAGQHRLEAELPRGTSGEWGRALGREHLDTLLLQEAVRAGAELWQPWSATRLVREGDAFTCEVRRNAGEPIRCLRARLVIAAHGSWDAGSLPTQQERNERSSGDLFGFKAHFLNSRLPPGLMPLLCFPGGYGGMVHTDGGRVSLSCCVRRDRLGSLRRTGSEAGEAVLEHILDSCAGVRRALERAKREGPWLAAGPLRPGIRRSPQRGIFRVGNAAGEAHPVVAEGISMAMQAAWLLVRHLNEWRRSGSPSSALDAVGQRYEAAWRRSFAPRMRAAAVIAHWAMWPFAVAGVLPLLRCFPGLLTLGARLSGKATRIVRPTR